MYKKILLAMMLVIAGIAIGYFLAGQQLRAKIKFPVKATLCRFEINPGKENVFREWMQWHHRSYDAIIETMDGKKMYAEAIFTDSANQPGVLYWLTIDGAGGAPVDNSPLPIDSIHNAYMKAVIRKGSRTVLQTAFYLLPDFLQTSIGVHQSQEK